MSRPMWQAAAVARARTESTISDPILAARIRWVAKSASMLSIVWVSGGIEVSL